MAMFNDLFELLTDVPPMLAAAWAAWLVAGVALVMWFRRAKHDAALPAPAPRPLSKPKPAMRPSSSPDLMASSGDFQTAERARPTPIVVGDPFGDLATMLDQPAAVMATEPAPRTPPDPRAPAESPILSSSGSPIRPLNKHRLDTDPGSGL